MAGEVVDTAYVEILPKVDNAAFGRITATAEKAIQPATKSIEATVDKTAAKVSGSFDKSFKKVEGGATKSSGRIKKAFQNTGVQIAATLGAAQLGARAFDFLKGSIEGASDLNETLSKTSVIMGEEGAKAAEKFANKAGNAFGQSKQQALDAIATFATFGKGAGLAGKDLAKFSTEFTGLASDLASFNNTTPQQAIDAIGGALRGETEPLRAYGVLIDAAAIKAEAMSQGLVKATKNHNQIKAAQVGALSAQAAYNEAVKEHGKDSLEAQKAQAALGTSQDKLKKATAGTIPELTQQQKVLATQSLIYKQTKDAQGDFARTSTGLANSQRKLSARFENIQAKVGKALLPAMEKLVAVLDKVTQGGTPTIIALTTIGVIVAAVTVALVTNTVAYVANGVAAAAAATKLFFFGTAEKASTVSIIANTVASVANRIAMVTASAAAKAWAATQWLLNAALAANPIGLVIIGIAALVAGFILAYKNSETFRNIINKLGATLKTVFMAYLSVVMFVFNKVRSILSGFLSKAKSVFSAVGSAFGAVLNKFRSVWGSIQNVFTNGVAAIKRIFGGLKNIGSDIWDGLTNGGRAAINGVISMLNSLIGVMNKAISGFNKLPKVDIPKIPTIGAFARGTNFAPGGTALVGEEGPELVHLPRGSRVKTARQTREIVRDVAAGGVSRGDVRVVQNFYGPTTSNGRLRELDWTLRYATGATGGPVAGVPA